MEQLMPMPVLMHCYAHPVNSNGTIDADVHDLYPRLSVLIAKGGSSVRQSIPMLDTSELIPIEWYYIMTR